MGTNNSQIGCSRQTDCAVREAAGFDVQARAPESKGSTAITSRVCGHEAPAGIESRKRRSLYVAYGSSRGVRHDDEIGPKVVDVFFCGDDRRHMPSLACSSRNRSTCLDLAIA
jgi:hypothetical protein